MIDAHHHLWDLAAREHRWLMGGQAWATDDELARLRRSFTLAGLAPLAAEAGVTGTVVIQTAAWTREASPSLRRTFSTWDPTVRWEATSQAAICLPSWSIARAP